MHYIDEHSFDDLYTAISYLRWSKYVNKSESISRIANEIILSKNKYHAYFYCLRFKYKSKQMQQIIIEENDPKFAFLFYRDIKCNKASMKKVILNSNSIKYITKLADELDPNYLKKAISLAIKNKDIHNSLILLKNKHCNKKSNLIDIVLNSNKPRHLLSLSKLTNNKNHLSVIEDKLINCKHFRYLTYFAMNSSKCNLPKIERFVRDNANDDEVLFFAEKVKRSKLNELLIFV